MRIMIRTGACLLAAVGLTGLAACNSASSGGNVVRNLLLYGGTTVPPAAAADIDDIRCPPVGVIDDSAALQTYAGGRVGDPAALRTQVSIGQLARECVGRPDGSIVLKVGVEGRALIGPAGSPGRLEAPVRIVVKPNDTVLANRFRRVPVAIPAGDTQTSFVVVEGDIVLPPGTGSDFEIEVGLGGSVPGGRPARERRG